MKKILQLNYLLIMFVSSIIAVLFLSIYTNICFTEYIKSEEHHIVERLKAVSISASSLVSGDELDTYRHVEDMQTQQYQNLREKLRDFSEKMDVKYVNYMRIIDGKVQYIIDNDFNEDSRVGLDTPLVEPEVEDAADGVLGAMEGKVLSHGIGHYTEGWEGLMSAYAPVYNTQGEIVAAVGVDIDDVVIMTSRQRLILLGVIQILSVILVFTSGLLCLLGYRREMRLANEANKSKSVFLAHMSHEIRTPMNAVIGMSELAAREYGKPLGLEYLSEIRQASGNLLSLINDILDFSKIESGNLQINTAYYITNSLLNDVLNIIRIRLEDKPIELIADLDPDIPASMKGDVARIRQALLNILGNAVKYTDKGFIKFTATGERVTENTIKLTFTVEDSGIGIRREDMPALFSEFTRLEQGGDRYIEGTGLGLSIARRLCRTMGGDVTVQSEYGKGSVFTVTLVQLVTDDRPMGFLREMPVLRKETGSVRFTAPSCRVLIVDDLVTNMKVAEGLLAPYSMDISTCLSGAEALDSIKENDFDLVLMDHMMPEMDGVEAVGHIRALKGERFEKLPIIALTANAISGMREMFLQNGFNDYLSKPIEMAKLDAIMERWVPDEKRRQASEEERDAPQAGDFIIEGLDTRKGLARSGGSVEAYRKVLESYCRDAAERLEILRAAPDVENLNLFTIHFHALKSASASIGAQALSEGLAFLEAAGKRGDLPTVAWRLDRCREELAGLVEHIRAALAAETGGPEEESAVSLDKTALLRLKEALEAEKIGLADEILKELAAQPLDPAVKTQISAISDHILLFEYKEAVTVINTLLKQMLP